MDETGRVAIIGYALRLPGCSSPGVLWDLLKRGHCAVRPGSGDLRDVARRNDYVSLDRDPLDVAGVDTHLFELSSSEAELMDPQRRLLLECTHEALEAAGQYPAPGSTGAYLSTGESEYFLLHLASRPDLFDTFGAMLLGMLNGQDFTATQIAYKLDLRGPAVNVNTACSSSLVAVHQAASALLAHECDLAVAGGASVAVALEKGYIYKSGGINSRVGRCRPFDAAADGTLPGSGAVVLVLKRYEDALHDGDDIRAVILGTAINNDGRRKVGFTAPSVEGQIEVIADALSVAGVEPNEIELVETHGTGTSLGDAIEFAALREVFAPAGRRSRPLYLGALKGNMGHTNAAAGAASLLKATLSLEQESITPLCGFAQQPPHIDLAGAGFVAPRSAVPWPRGPRRRLAGISSFGIGGTNAHVVLEEAPPLPPRQESSRPALLLCSENTRSMLDTSTENLALLVAEGVHLADIAYSTAVSRQARAFRRFAVGSEGSSLASMLRTASVRQARQAENVALIGVFAAESPDWAQYAWCLHALEPVFKDVMDRGLDLLKAGRESGADAPLSVLSAYATARLWQAWGFQPSMILAAGAGEWAAAVYAGLLTLDQALRLAHAQMQGRLDPTLARITSRPSQLRLYSLSEGRWIEPGETISFEGWGLPTNRWAAEAGMAFSSALNGNDARIVEFTANDAVSNPMASISTSPAQRLVQGEQLSSPAQRFYSRLGDYWADGGVVDWRAFYQHEPRRKHRLPPYPYQRKRYWVDRKRSLAADARAIPGSSDIESWLYIPTWELVAEDTTPTQRAGDRHLVIGGTASFREGLSRALQAQGATVLELATVPDAAASRHADTIFWLGFEGASVSEEIAALWQFARRGLRSKDRDAPPMLCLVYPMGKDAAGRLPVRCAALEAALRVLSQEVTSLRCRSVGILPDATFERVVPSITGPEAFRSLYVSGADVFARSYSHAERAAQAPVDFKPNGHYVVIGGLGRVGRILTHRLAQSMPLRLTVTGRHWIAPTKDIEVIDLGTATAAPPKLPHSAGPGLSPDVKSQLETSTRLLAELAASLCADYAISRGLSVEPNARRALADWSRTLCSQATHSPITRTILRLFVDSGWVCLEGDEIVALGTAASRRTPVHIFTELETEAPDFVGVARRLMACANRFADVLIDGLPGAEVLYPGGSDRFLHQTAPGPAASAPFFSCARALAEHIRTLASLRGSRPLRILEIGAGSGSLSRHLLQELQSLHVEYCYTDVSRAFLAGARQLATENNWGWLTTRVLDISRDPLEQEFSCGEFDLIVGYNVVHIAPHVESCVARLATLLQPGGTLALIESTQWRPAHELVWGMSPDWWRFADARVASGSPLLGAAEWLDVLAHAGFGHRQSWTPDGEETDDVLLLASCPSRDSVDKTLRSSAVHERRVAQIQELASFGSHVRYVRADLRDPEETTALFRALTGNGERIDGIVHAATTSSQALGLIDELSVSAIRHELDVKVNSLREMQPLVARARPDFVAVMSSMSSVLGGLGHLAYAAANSAQDALCAELDGQDGIRWLSTNWDAWGERERIVGASVQEHKLEEHEAVQCLRAALRSRHSGQVLVSKNDLFRRLDQWLVRAGRPSGTGGTQDNPDDLAKRVGTLWTQLLGLSQPPAPETDFFTAGGDSLLAIEMLSQLKSRWGLNIELAEFMRTPRFGAHLNALRTASPLPWNPLVTLVAEGCDPALFCVHPGGGSIRCYQTLVDALRMNVPVHAFRSRRFASPPLPPHASLEEMAAEYVRALRVARPRGPIVLLGYCFGGMIAFEMACQLAAERHHDLRLVLVDSHPPGADDGYLDSRDLIEAQLAQAPLIAPMQSWIHDLDNLSPSEQARAVAERIDWSGVQAAGRAAIEQTILEIIVCNTAKNRYCPRRVLDAPVHLMRIDDKAFHRDRNAVVDLGWQAFVGPGIEVSWLAGTHAELFSATRIAAVARGIEAIVGRPAAPEAHPRYSGTTV